MNLQQSLAEYQLFLQNILHLKSYSTYCKAINCIDNWNGQQTCVWIMQAMKNSNAKDARQDLENSYNNAVKINPPKRGSVSNWKTYLLRFGDFVFGYKYANQSLANIKDFDKLACDLIAKTALFCSFDTALQVSQGKLGSRNNKNAKGNIYCSWYNCEYRRIKTIDIAQGFKKGNIIQLNGKQVHLDDNTYANNAIKSAIIEDFINDLGLRFNRKDFEGYEACHIWDGSCYDEKFYSSVTNLVLIPRAIAGLSDHFQAVKDLLQYEAWRRFSSIPNIQFPCGNIIPQKLTYYPKDWR